MLKYPNEKKWQCGEGWYNLIKELIEKINVISEDQNLEVVQIKEKFGGLRFYINGGSNEVYELIHQYENKSLEICEVCGNAGAYRSDLGWKSTLCQKHFLKTKIKEMKYWDLKDWQLFITEQFHKLKGFTYGVKKTK